METVELTGRTRQFAGGLGVLAWAAVVTSLVLSVLSAAGIRESLWQLLVFSGFFTIWTNAAVALALTAPLVAPHSRLGRFFRRPGVVTGLAASIALVAIAYELLLRGSWDPLGPALILDLLLHYLIPTAFVGYWWLSTPKSAVDWRGPLVWLSYPAAYAAHALVRGELFGIYPYPFLDVAEFGYGDVLVNIAGLGVAFLVIALAFVATARASASL